MCIPDDFLIAPLTVEIVEKTDLASKRLLEYQIKDIEKWKQMSIEERNKIIDKIYQETDLEM